MRASLKYIDDRNQFILDLPFSDPADPHYVPGFSDYGSMNTNEANNISVPTPDGQLQMPLDNGLRTKAYWLTADAGFDLAHGLRIENAAQIWSTWVGLCGFKQVNRLGAGKDALMHSAIGMAEGQAVELEDAWIRVSLGSRHGWIERGKYRIRGMDACSE